LTESLAPVAILAGGLGTRLGPLTADLPKALVEIGGEPFIAHQLRLLHQHGVCRVVVCIGFRGDAIHEAVGDGSNYGLAVAYSYDGPELLGTAGAVKKALPLLGETFFVIYGDSYLTCNYAQIQATFEQSRKLALMTVFHNDGLWDRSNVEFSAGCIRAYSKTARNPRMHHIDYGLGIFKSDAFASVPAGTPFDLAALYEQLLERGELAACEIDDRFYEIGSHAGLAETRAYLTARA
jgi:NDP-sugar pyrophosphorylase family protein